MATAGMIPKPIDLHDIILADPASSGK
jgi:hypothetical protein